MNVAVTHDLPSGGALRVLSEWCARTDAEQVTVYVRDLGVHSSLPFPDKTRIVACPLGHRDTIGGELARLWTSPRDGRRLAGLVDAGGHDVVFCFPSVLTQAPDVLPALRTPSLYYAPEPLRSAYEPPELRALPDDWRGEVTRRGLNPLEPRRRTLDRRFLRHASRIVTHSAFTQQTLREIYGVSSDVVALGVDANLFTPGDAPREDFVLAVGALHPLKGHELVVDAVGALVSPRPRLVIVGDRGFSGSSLERRAAARGVDLEVRHRIAFSELLELYRRAAVVACGQIREPFGLTPLEAMACETPVVAVNEGGLRETVRDGEDGLLVVRDPRAMASALSRILKDRRFGAELGANGRAKVRRDWTWESAVAGFDRLLASAGEAGAPLLGTRPLR